jgi:acetylornithine deacetylase/succinyl-diaminopimelate desuccinylase-like protein
MSERVIEHLASHKDAILERLLTLIRFPSVSTDPAFAEGMRGAREFLLDRLRAIGMPDVRLLEAPGGQPAVYGAWTGAGPDKPTIMIYGHYDVQPADPLELWQSPPFDPAIRDGRIYARGASDVKGSTTIAIETIAGFLAVEGGCPVNVKLFLEGEEEVGSPSLPALIASKSRAAGGRRHAVRRWWRRGGAGGGAEHRLPRHLRAAIRPAHGAEGRPFGQGRRCHAQCAARDGTADRDAARRGRPRRRRGFRGRCAPMTNALRVETASLPLDEAAWYADFGATPFGDPAYTVRERTTLRPTVEVNGMWGGYTGQGGKTVTPAEAHAKLTMRLIPGQDPVAAQAAVKAHLERHAPDGVALEFHYRPDGTRAFTLAADHPLRAAAAAVLRREKGGEPAVTRLGGTVPITTMFQEELGIDSLMFGLASPDEDAHAPNEFFRLSSLEEGLRLWPMLLSELGTMRAADFQRR